ncbi:MAG: DEAD/DEAH box helicase [Bacteroidales bacterium]|nr:DEAD/DEAH box helicase [Bacteroidales bacterium]
MSMLTDKILKDENIQSLFSKSEMQVLLSEVSESIDVDFDSQRILRLAFILFNSEFSSDEPNEKKLRNTYLLLKSIDISDTEQLKQFGEIFGIDGIDNELLYYFYFSVISISNDKIINIRINLLDYSETSLKEESDIWRNRILNKIFNAFVFLSRKKNGFEDIRKGITLIRELQQEQLEFEKKYLDKYKLNEEVEQAYSLLGLYHLSKTIVETATYLETGYNYKKRIESEIRQHADVAKKLLYKEPRLQSIVSILEISLKTICNNSIWNKTSFNDKVKQLCETKAKQEMIDLLPSQRDALNQNLLDVVSNVTVLQMPTSAGKSLLAEFNMLVTKALRQDAKIIYIVPSRALVNQVYFDLKTDLQSLGLNVEKTSSAIEIDPNENNFLNSEEIDILVSTPEKLDLLIRRKHPSVDDVSLFVVDEAHTIQNGIRGARLELLLTLLRRERPNAKFMLLSPFIKDAGRTITEWLGGGNSIEIDWKPAEKLFIGIDVHKTKKNNEIKYEILNSPYSTFSISQKGAFPNPIEISSKGKKNPILEFSINHFVKKDKAQLVLCWGKKMADKRADFIYNHIPDKQVSDEVNLVRKFIDDEIGRETTLTKVLEKGICTHHSGISDETKLMLEYLIREKKINYVCSTTTVAEGVNFPISSVFFDDYRKGRYDKLSTNDFWNISGRAGRTLVDNFGKIILPFNSPNNIENAKNLIEQSADELVSVLSELFVNADEIISSIEKNEINIPFKNYYNSIAPLIQYFVHIISVGGHEAYASEIEDLFKDSFEYYKLDSYDKKEKFIQVCKTIYTYLQDKYGENTGVLSFADKTGFSVPSVLNVMKKKSLNPNISDLNSWNPNSIFDRNNPNNLTEKIEVIAALRETRIGTDSDKAPFNPAIIANILISWVNGDNFETMSKIHPLYNSFSDNERINEFVSKMNDIRFKSSWGLSALEGIVKGNEAEIKDTYIPSYAYYGVNNSKSLALRMIGIPRSLSSSLSQIIEKDISSYSLNKIRKMIKDLGNSDWDNLKPKKSTLSGSEWKRITEVLIN